MHIWCIFSHFTLNNAFGSDTVKQRIICGNSFTSFAEVKFKLMELIGFINHRVSVGVAALLNGLDSRIIIPKCQHFPRRHHSLLILRTIYCAKFTVNLTCSKIAESDLRRHYSAVITCLLFSGISKVQPSDFASPFSSRWLKTPHWAVEPGEEGASVVTGRLSLHPGDASLTHSSSDSLRCARSILAWLPLMNLDFTQRPPAANSPAQDGIKWLRGFRDNIQAIWLHAWVMFGHKMLKGVCMRVCVCVLDNDLPFFSLETLAFPRELSIWQKTSLRYRGLSRQFQLRPPDFCSRHPLRSLQPIRILSGFASPIRLESRKLANFSWTELL